MNLGLVCMLHNQKSKKGFSGIKACESATQQQRNSKLTEATLHNIKNALECLQWCADNNVKGYRISSSLIPFHQYFNWQSKEILTALTMVRLKAKKYNIQLIIHPDQFNILNSPNREVITKTVAELTHQAKICEILDIKHMIIHTGGVYGDKDEAMSRFMDNYLNLPKQIQDLIAVENCHYFDANDIKLMADLIGIKTVYDAHHQRVIHNNTELSTHKLNITRLQPVICHISSGKSNPCDKSHADYISADDAKLFKELFANYDGVVEVEAKKKDLAIKELM